MEERVVIVSQRHDKLTPSLMKLLPSAVAASSFNFPLQEGDIICWLPNPQDPVDDLVSGLASQLDRSVMQPSRIVMLAVPGTADDATDSQLKQWFGNRATGIVMAYQYAIKMIDELEIPYTIVRSLPLYDDGDHPSQVTLAAEGQPMFGKQVGVHALADFLKLVLTTGSYRNQSVGVLPSNDQ